MKTTVSIIGWLFTYTIIIALIPFGTCTQGDDDPWRASLLLYSGIASIGICCLLFTANHLARVWYLGLPHIVTVILMLWKTPSYWWRCTLQGQHICAGLLQGKTLSAFPPEVWHRFWAPVVTLLGMTCVVLCFAGYRQRILSSKTQKKTTM